MAQSKSDKFSDIYTAICREISYNHQPVSTNAEPLVLEPVELAEKCFLDITKQDLLNLKTNEDFASVAYFKLLNRAAKGRDIKIISDRIVKDKSTREQEIQKILDSQEYEAKNVKVGLG